MCDRLESSTCTESCTIESVWRVRAQLSTWWRLLQSLPKRIKPLALQYQCAQTRRDRPVLRTTDRQTGAATSERLREATASWPWLPPLFSNRTQRQRDEGLCHSPPGHYAMSTLHHDLHCEALERLNPLSRVPCVRDAGGAAVAATLRAGRRSARDHVAHYSCYRSDHALDDTHTHILARSSLPTQSSQSLGTCTSDTRLYAGATDRCTVRESGGSTAAGALASRAPCARDRSSTRLGPMPGAFAHCAATAVSSRAFAIYSNPQRPQPGSRGTYVTTTSASD